MKERLLRGWNVMRILWLIVGVGIVTQSVNEKNFLMLLPGLYFVFAALANVGCFAGNCSVDYTSQKSNKGPVADVEFEEVQSKK